MTGRRFMLDADTVSFVLRGQGQAGAHLTALAPSEVCLYAFTGGVVGSVARKRLRLLHV